jgi:hypothetical protein
MTQARKDGEGMMKQKERDKKDRVKRLGRISKKVGTPYHRLEKRIPSQLDTIMFMRVEGFSIRQIAEYLRVSESTVLRRMKSSDYDTTNEWRYRMRDSLQKRDRERASLG